MFKSIVVGLDGSDQSKHALGFAAGLAREEGAKLIVAHVEEDIAPRVNHEGVAECVAAVLMTAHLRRRHDE